MTLWLKFIPTGSFHIPLVVDADKSPCPAVMAGGMNTLSPDQHYLEDDGRMDLFTIDPSKPPYRVPSMDEVRAVPWNGLTVASTFSGCGGSSTGYRMAGYRVLWANEFVPAAQDSYAANMAEYTVLDRRDIRQVLAVEILDAIKMKPGELDLFDGSPPCFAAGTLILTRRGLVPIETVREGDMVVTHLGRWRKVSGTTKRNGATIRVRGHGHPGITTTSEHPFFVREASFAWDAKRRSYRRELAMPDWCPIGDCISVADGKIRDRLSFFWGMRRSYPEDIVPEVCRADARIDDVGLTPAFFWIVGLWLGDGWLRTGRAHVKSGQRGEVLICAAKHEAAVVRSRIEAAGFCFSEAEMRTTIRFTICHAGLADWLEEDFGRGAGGKTVPYWAFGMHASWRQALYDGYIFADGTTPSAGHERSTSISWPLTLGMAMIARSIGKAAGLRCYTDKRTDHRIENRRVNVADATYSMDCFDRPKSFVVEDEYCWGAVKEIAATGIIEPVYNLHVEGDESYIADGLVVHNCQAFSTAGQRERGWGKDRDYGHGAEPQKNEDMFYEFVRLLEGLKPRTFVAENVSGLVKGTAKGYFIEILRRLKACGYNVEARLLDAQWLGVPQSRQRIIFVGVRDDIGLTPAFPVPLPYRYSVREACPWLGGGARLLQGNHVDRKNEGRDLTDRVAPAVAAGDASRRAPDQFVVEERVIHDDGRPSNKAKDITDRPSPAITAGPNDPADGGGQRNHFQVVRNSSNPSKSRGRKTDGDAVAPTVIAHRANLDVETGGPVEPESDISRYAIGAEADKLRPGETSRKYFQLERADPDQPCPAILTQSAKFPSGASVIHPTERRKFTIAELRRIGAFPDDFILTGSYAQQWERIGNSVPPLMMRAIAAAVRDGVLLPARAAAAPARNSTAILRASGKGRAASPPASPATGASRAPRGRRRQPAEPTGAT